LYPEIKQMKIIIAPTQYENVPHMAICPENFDPAFPTAMKRIPRAFYRPERKQWIAPKDRRVWQTLKDVFGTENIIIERAPAPPAARYEAAVTAWSNA
jgi:hypothetical protein